MKKIEAIIKPFRLDDVKTALDEAGVENMIISDVRGSGRQNTHREMYRGNEYEVDFLPKVKIEFVLPDDRLKGAVAAIMKGSRPSRKDNDKVFVSHIEDAVCVQN
jgi:nitrogen regulatory protein P-II 1